MFFLLTLMFGVLAIVDRQTDRERNEKDERDMEAFLLKQEFRKNPAQYYVNAMKQKHKNAKETYYGLKRATEQFNAVN